jgi:hypothetical protein
MNCERSLNGEEARYRVYTDAREMDARAVCPGEARKLGVTVERMSQE